MVNACDYYLHHLNWCYELDRMPNGRSDLESSDDNVYRDPNEFHNCLQCFNEWDSSDEMYNCINSWLERIRKYSQRFPDYRMIYVNLPKVI